MTHQFFHRPGGVRRLCVAMTTGHVFYTVYGVHGEIGSS